MSYSTSEIRELVSNESLVLSDLPKRRLSISQVVIEVQNKKKIDIITSPVGFESDPLIDSILHFFTLPQYATRVSASRKRSYNKTVQNFFSFIENETNWQKKLIDDTPQSTLHSHVFNDWLTHLKRTTSPKSTYRKLLTMSQLLTATAKSLYGKISAWPSSINGSHWVDRRLIFLRGLDNEQKTWIFSRSTGTRGSIGVNQRA